MSDNEYDDEEGEEFPWAEIPTGTKGLRACKRCSLVKGNDQVGGGWRNNISERSSADEGSWRT